MNVSLTPQLERLIQQKVESGMYHSASEVIRDALRLLDERDKTHQAKLDALRDEIRKGIDSGSAGELDMETVKAEARRSFEEKQR